MVDQFLTVQAFPSSTLFTATTVSVFNLGTVTTNENFVMTPFGITATFSLFFVMFDAKKLTFIKFIDHTIK